MTNNSILSFFIPKVIKFEYDRVNGIFLLTGPKATVRFMFHQYFYHETVKEDTILHLYYGNRSEYLLIYAQLSHLISSLVSEGPCNKDIFLNDI